MHLFKKVSAWKWILKPPQDIRAQANGVMIFNAIPLLDKSKQPRVTSNNPLAKPVEIVSGKPTRLAILDIPRLKKDNSPQLNNTSISIKKIAMYPPTKRIEIIESYIFFDKISCVCAFGT